MGGGGTTVKDIERNHLKIGNDVWIGYGTIITANCHFIGNGAVIGAGSVITKDVEPYSIVAGNPAHLIRYRFDTDTIEMLEKSKWFLLEPQLLLQYYRLIDKPITWSEEIIGRGVEKHEGDKL